MKKNYEMKSSKFIAQRVKVNKNVNGVIMHFSLSTIDSNVIDAETQIKNIIKGPQIHVFLFNPSLQNIFLNVGLLGPARCEMVNAFLSDLLLEKFFRLKIRFNFANSLLLFVLPDLNEDLVKLLMQRDELHMEQDSMLVDIEDLTRFLYVPFLPFPVPASFIFEIA